MGTVINLCNRLAEKNKQAAIIKIADKLIQEAKEKQVGEISKRLDRLDRLYINGCISKADYDRIDSILTDMIIKLVAI